MSTPIDLVCISKDGAATASESGVRRKVSASLAGPGEVKHWLDLGSRRDVMGLVTRELFSRKLRRQSSEGSGGMRAVAAALRLAFCFVVLACMSAERESDRDVS